MRTPHSDPIAEKNFDDNDVNHKTPYAGQPPMSVDDPEFDKHLEDYFNSKAVRDENSKAKY